MSRCIYSRTGRHEWTDIVLTAGGNGYYPHKQCRLCGITSWLTFWGEIYDDVLERRAAETK